MSEERNYPYELFLIEKENKELREHIEELKSFKEEYIYLQTIKQKKEHHIYPSFIWAVCITFGIYVLFGVVQSAFPALAAKAFDFLSLFQFLGVGCALYFIVYSLRTRNIGKRPFS